MPFVAVQTSLHVAPFRGWYSAWGIAEGRNSGEIWLEVQIVQKHAGRQDEETVKETKYHGHIAEQMHRKAQHISFSSETKFNCSRAYKSSKYKPIQANASIKIKTQR